MCPQLALVRHDTASLQLSASVSWYVLHASKRIEKACHSPKLNECLSAKKLEVLGDQYRSEIRISDAFLCHNERERELQTSRKLIMRAEAYL